MYCEGKGCGIKLHQRNCGGPSKIPRSKWFCEPCSSGLLVNKKGESSGFHCDVFSDVDRHDVGHVMGGNLVFNHIL